MKKFDIIVVGAGPAGLLAAGSAASMGAKVLILEKMKQAGRKLLITGSGRCNVTNNLPKSEFLKHVQPNAKFLKPAFANFFSNDMLELLKDYGVDLVLEGPHRYFPKSDSAKDVLNALLHWSKSLGVELWTEQRVEKLIHKDNKLTGLLVNAREIVCEHVILATGGISYPRTGSNGDGYELAKQCGHQIERVHAALVGLETNGSLAQNLQGLNLSKVRAVVWANDKKIAERTAEMLFTHYGITGPAILSLSRYAVAALKDEMKVEVSIDLLPDLKEEELEQKLRTDFDENGKKQLANLLRFYLPNSLISEFIAFLQLDASKFVNQLNKDERKKIKYHLKHLSFSIKRSRSYKEAIITAGGVATNEIYPKRMESKLVSGLYFAGEMIDLDAETGGFNLQIAYSTGFLAGKSAAQAVLQE